MAMPSSVHEKVLSTLRVNKAKAMSETKDTGRDPEI